MSFCDSRDLEKIANVPLGVEVWPSVFGCSNTVLQQSLRATPLKNNSCHGEKPKFFQVILDREMFGVFNCCL